MYTEDLHTLTHIPNTLILIMAMMELSKKKIKSKLYKSPKTLYPNNISHQNTLHPNYVSHQHDPRQIGKK